MSSKRNTLSNLINEIHGGIQYRRKTIPSLNYEKVIQSQQEIIKTLQKEINYLRQYLIYVADFEDLSTREEEKGDQFLPTESILSVDRDKSGRKANGLKGLITQIMKVVQAKSPDQILPQLRKLDEKANRKIEPVFIEKIKQKEVPVMVERIIEVEKPVIQEKIVYKEKIVEVPLFREKVTEKFEKSGERSLLQEHGLSPRFGKNNKFNYVERDDTIKKCDKTRKFKERFRNECR